MRIGIDCRKIADFGIGTYIRGLLHALVEIGGEDYIAFGPREIAGMLPMGVEHAVVDAPKYSIRELFVVGRSQHIDLFHAPHYVVPFVRMPFVVTIHDLIHLRHHNPLARMYARAMIGRAVRRSRRIITVSDAVRQDIAATFGHSERIVVTPNGVDPIFTPLGAKAEGRYFLFVGNDKPHKNVDRLVDAFDRITNDVGRASARPVGLKPDPHVQLVLAGGDFDRFRHRPNVARAGFVSDAELAALYRGAIALVQPSLDEGFGLPALEAMASGTPVITSKARAFMEVTGDAALHVDAISIDAIADAMTRVMRDETLRATMIARGRARASVFTWRRCAEMTREIYRRIA